ncbi:tetratricopeptide repeat (TPR)-like superfamily protein isoform X2 [Tasmannia lanceolata]|uniref:tetratricopeptide repeat (TPR)-like superfamily protein isoform X2 n=1 Tax=Tasmannia lanceolata TaxID=3420 RepID=UPI0040627D57
MARMAEDRPNLMGLTGAWWWCEAEAAEDRGFRAGFLKFEFASWNEVESVWHGRHVSRLSGAHKVYEWMIDQGERFKLTSSDIAIHLDLISKVNGISNAEDYFSGLPEASKDMRTYGALLNAYVQATMTEKAEAVVEKMRNGGYANHALPYNVIMSLYMKIKEYKKVILMIFEMKKNNVPFDIYSYNIWITTCGAMGDTEQMEQVVESMTQDNSINANWTTYSTLASMYIKLGHFEKAKNCLKDVELRLTGRDRIPYNFLLSLYSSIGKKEEVYRVWSCYKSSFPSILNLGYFSMISSLVRLGDIDGAEMIYKEWLSVKTSYDPRICNIFMGWYVRAGLLKKAEDFLAHVREIGGKPNPNTWEILAEGYIRDKQISNALSCMKEAATIKRSEIWRPRPANIASFLALCEEQADMESVDMILEVLEKGRCLDIEPYKSLIKTHVGGDMKAERFESSIDKDEIDGDDETEMLLNQTHWVPDAPTC